MKFAICNETFQGWKIEDIFRTAREIGYDGVEIAPFTIADSVENVSPARRREIVQSAADNGIEIVGLHWLLVKPEGLYINHPDASVRRRTRDYLDALIRFCGDLGGRVLIFGSPKQRSVHPDLTYDQAWGYACETFAHCADTAAEVGAYLCIEPLARRETDFVNTVTDALRMVREVGKPHFRTMLDMKAISDDGRPLPTIIEEAASMAMHVHVNDANGRGPGTGDTDFVEIGKALKKIGCDGYCSVEVFDYEPDPVTIATDSLSHLRKTFGP